MIKRASLETACYLVTDGTHDSPKLQKDGVPFIKGKHISGGSIDFEGCDYITHEDHLKVIARSKPEHGDTLFANIGTVGSTAYVGVDFEFSIKNVALFKPNPDIVDPRYLYYYVSGPRFQAEIQNIVSGSAQPFVGLSTLRNHEIEYPPLPIQRRVAGILSAYDDLIENNTRRIRLLEEMARALYREWFVHYRFPGHENVEMVEHDELGSVPARWDVLPSSEVIDINPRTKVPKEGMKPYLPMGSLSETSMLISDVEERTGNSGAKFRNGDTLFARITPSLENGKTGFVQFLPTPESVAFGSTEFIVLRSKSVSPYFVYLLARTDEFRENAILSMAGASGRQRVRKECFDTFLIARPTPDVLSKFDSVMAPMFELVRTLARENHTLRETRDLLLPRLVSGALPVEAAEEELGAVA